MFDQNDGARAASNRGDLLRAFLLLISLLLLCRTLSARDEQLSRTKTPYGIGVLAGYNFLTYHHTCVGFSVFFIGQFFDGVQKVEGRNGTEFRKGALVLTVFPETLTVYIKGFPSDCTPGTVRGPSSDCASGLMEHAAFKLRWKRGDEARPVNVTSVQEHHSSLHWDYMLQVSSNGVPLTDALVIAMSLRGGIADVEIPASLN